MGMNRRSFLKQCAAGASAMALAGASSPLFAAKAAKRPNILFIVSEDNSDHLGVATVKNACTRRTWTRWRRAVSATPGPMCPIRFAVRRVPCSSRATTHARMVISAWRRINSRCTRTLKPSRPTSRRRVTIPVSSQNPRESGPAGGGLCRSPRHPEF